MRIVNEKIDKYLDRGDEIGQALNDTNTLVDTLREMRGQIDNETDH